MKKIEETIFIDNDNTFTVEYGGIVFPTPTKIEFELNGKAVDSVANASFFSSTLEVDGQVIFNLGSAGYLSVDGGFATVTIFDAANTNGVVYSSPIGPTRLRVRVI